MTFTNLGEVVIAHHSSGSQTKVYERHANREEAEERVAELTATMNQQEIDAFFEGEVSTTPLYQEPIKEMQMSMTEPTTTVALGGRKVTVTYGRTVRPADYESKRVEASIEIDLPPGLDGGQVENILARETSVAASHVLSTLDLPFTYDEETQRVLEVFPESTVVSAPQGAAQPAMHAPPPLPPTQAPSRQGGSGGGWDLLEQEFFSGQRDRNGHLPSFYDNRLSKKGNQPDFKNKQDGKGYWIVGSFGPGSGAPEHIAAQLQDLQTYPAPAPRQ